MVLRLDYSLSTKVVSSGICKPIVKSTTLGNGRMYMALYMA